MPDGADDAFFGLHSMRVPALPPDCTVSVTAEWERSVPTTLQARLRIAVSAAGGQSRVSGMSGVALRNLNYFLAGREPRASAVVAIARACGVRVAWLVAGEGDPHAAEKADPHRARIIKCSLHLPC